MNPRIEPSKMKTKRNTVTYNLMVPFISHNLKRKWQTGFVTFSPAMERYFSCLLKKENKIKNKDSGMKPSLPLIISLVRRYFFHIWKMRENTFSWGISSNMVSWGEGVNGFMPKCIYFLIFSFSNRLKKYLPIVGDKVTEWVH